MIVAACIETGIEGSCCNVLRRVHAGLDVDAGCAMHLLVYFRGGTMRMSYMFYISGNVCSQECSFTGSVESCTKEST